MGPTVSRGSPWGQPFARISMGRTVGRGSRWGQPFAEGRSEANRWPRVSMEPTVSRKTAKSQLLGLKLISLTVGHRKS